jgi:glycosyltransferase involved in cell wall biosynthesis
VAVLTVIIATWNGGASLPRALEAFCRITPPPVPWKLIVAENGSTDGTAEIALGYAGRLPLSLLRLPTPGKSAALNAAIEQIDEGLVLFADDDVLPDPGWLVGFGAAAAAQPEYGVFGGAILPQWESEPPAWITDAVALSACFGTHLGLGLDEGPCPPDFVFGGSMAIRSELFRRGYRFDESRGPRGTRNYVGGEDTELTRRMVRDGQRAWHCGRAVARHIVPAHHLTEHWLLERAVAHGRGLYALGHEQALIGRGSHRSATVRLGRAMALAAAREALARLGGSRAAHFRWRWRLRYLVGLAQEHARSRDQPPARGAR